MIKNTQQKWEYNTYDFQAFSEKEFMTLLITELNLNSTYSLLFKLNFEGNIFYMSDQQIGIVVKNYHNINYYKNIYNILVTRILTIMDKYYIIDYPVNITILYKVTKTLPELRREDIKAILLNTNIIKKNNKKILNIKYLPLTNDIRYFGNKIEGYLKKIYIGKLIKTMSYLGINIPKYLLNINTIPNTKVFISTIKHNKTKDKKSYLKISILIDLNLNSELNLNLNENLIKQNECYFRVVFDRSTGITLYEVIDIIENSNKFERLNKNISLNIKNNNIISIKQKIIFDSIKNISYNIYKGMSNTNFGVLDVETYKVSENESKICALGYVTLKESSKLNTFYLPDLVPNLDSNLFVILCLNSLLIEKYHNYIFYIHNMGKFDAVFLHKILKEFNLHKKEEYYILKSIFRDDRMLKLSVSIRISNKKYIKINFVDSINILNFGLDVLGKELKVNNIKDIFPYNFVTKDNLNYIGETPNIKFYNNITELEYKTLYFKSNWNLKLELIKYLEKDLLCLLEVLEKFNSSLFLNHNIQMTECLTISRIALTKFLNYYLKESKIPLINKFKIFNFIYFGYYGGITEVYKPYGVNLKNYDVNSLYPYVALKPMPGINCTYIENISNNLNITELFGFFQAKVKTNNNLYLGILPIKTDIGLIFPNGEFIGIWSSEELKLAQMNGYDIEIIRGYNFNKVEGVFNDYVNELFKQKAITTGVEKAINKSLLNNLIGRFGMNIIKPITKCVNKEELDYIISTRKVKSIHDITKNDFLITYLPLVNKQICQEYGLDYIKVLNKEKNKNIEKSIDVFNDVSIAISAMVTSYARVFMTQIKIKILELGGKIYYSDTDNLITDLNLEMLDPNLIGKGLGQFKLVNSIKEGYFISNKTYCLILDNGEVIIVSKGVQNNSLTLNDFKSLYYASENVKGMKTITVKNYEKGSVTINEKEIILNYDAFKKRDKIYNNKNLWIDTKPLIYNNIVKSIVCLNKSN